MILAPQDHRVGSRFDPRRNESSRMSMSMHSEKNKWYEGIGSLTNPASPSRVPSTQNFGTAKRNNSMYGNFGIKLGATGSRLQNDFEISRSVHSRQSVGI